MMAVACCRPLRFEARVALPATDATTALQLRRAALALATWLHQLGRFPGVASGAIDVIAALPEDPAAAQPGLRTGSSVVTAGRAGRQPVGRRWRRGAAGVLQLRAGDRPRP
jgi:hypothetical protein